MTLDITSYQSIQQEDILKRNDLGTSALSRQVFHHNRLKRSTRTIVAPNSFDFFTIISFLLILLIATHTHSRSQAELSVCNFEKYFTGCFSQSNFVCDLETNLCRCQPQTPILIDNRFCVKKSHHLQTCHYSQQCDNTSNYYCSYLDHTGRVQFCSTDNQHQHQNQNQDPTPGHHISYGTDGPTPCRCLRLNVTSDSSLILLSKTPDLDAAIIGGDDSSGSWMSTTTRGVDNGPMLTNAAEHESQKNNQNNNRFGSKQLSRPNYYNNNQNQHHHHHHSSSSILPKLVWLFLVITLLLLIALLFLIKFQSYRTERPFHQQEDQRSIDSEHDVPPPYEVAIRMKI